MTLTISFRMISDARAVPKGGLFSLAKARQGVARVARVSFGPERRAARLSTIVQSKLQAASSAEADILAAELAALDASIGSLQGQLRSAEASRSKEREVQAAYESEIASLNANLAMRQPEQEAEMNEEEAREVQRMLSRVETLREDAAHLTLTLTERKGEIEGLKRQLAEFEESSEPAFAYAGGSLKEREADGGVATLEAPNWGNDWGSNTIPSYMLGRRLPEAPAAFNPAVADAPPQPIKDNIIRELSAPGLLLAAGAMGIGRVWNVVKQAFPPEGHRWLDLSAISLVLGAACYAAYQR